MRISIHLRQIVGRLFGHASDERPVVDHFVPPGPPDAVTRDLAANNARSTYQGPPEGEPHVAHQLQALESHLTRLYRTDEQLRTTQAAAADAAHAIEDATNEVPRVIARTQAALHDGAQVPATTQDPAEAARWAMAARGRTERRQAEQALAAARRAQVLADRELETASSRTIDRLADAAAGGLVPINAYLAAFDQARAHLGRPGLGLLGEEMVRALVGRAVRPLAVGQVTSDA